MLQRDAGNPDWIDLYINKWRRWPDKKIKTCLHTWDHVVLIGYSSGGSYIGHLTHKLSNISAVVLYESPLIGIDEVAGDFPVLIIWNNDSPRRNSREAKDTFEAWNRHHDVTIKFGHGRHMKRTSYFPWIGHGWDTSLNPMIHNWIKENTK